MFPYFHRGRPRRCIRGPRTEPRSCPLGHAEIQEAAPTSAQSDTLDRPHFAARSGTVRPLAAGGAAWLRDGSCMSREAHVQF